MKLYGLKTCDTCRAARKALAEAGQVVEFVDVRADPPGADFYSLLVETHGAASLNKRSKTWAGLDEAERALPAAELLARHPTVMKRPVIAADGSLHLGWTDEVRAALIP